MKQANDNLELGSVIALARYELEERLSGSSPSSRSQEANAYLTELVGWCEQHAISPSSVKAAFMESVREDKELSALLHSFFEQQKSPSSWQSLLSSWLDWRVRIATGALVAAAAAFFVLSSPPDLLPRGSNTNARLSIGDAPCSLALGSTARCDWPKREGRLEELQLFYRCTESVSCKNASVVMVDSKGELSELIRRPLSVTTGDSSCPDAWCWLEGGRYRAPSGPLDLYVIFNPGDLELTSLDDINRLELTTRALFQLEVGK